LKQPNISVIICTYNRANFISEALESLARQTLSSAHFEIIVVNNNCTDNTEQICRNFKQNQTELDFNYVIETNQGLSFARNRGIAESKYEILTYIDDDAYAKPKFLTTIRNFFIQNPATVGIGGRVIPRYEVEEPQWMNPYLDGFVAKLDMGDKQKRFGKKQYPVGCNMTYTKEILLTVGGFNNRLKWRADDKYIGIKVREISDEVYYLPNLEVEHSIDAYRTSDENFKAFCLKFGNEEAIRVRDISSLSYLLKGIEFAFKLIGSFILMMSFFFKCELSKGAYTFKYRWWATIGFLKEE